MEWDKTPCEIKKRVNIINREEKQKNNFIPNKTKNDTVLGKQVYNVAMEKRSVLISIRQTKDQKTWLSWLMASAKLAKRKRKEV